MPTRTTSTRSGFTLIELMIAVAILGILAAIAIPAFSASMRRSKTVEATGNLNALFKAAATYYAAERTGPTVAGTTVAGCTVGNASLTPASPGTQKVLGNFSANTSFAALSFSVADYIYYGYAIDSIGSDCGRAANTQDLYTLYAQGDLDGDGTPSRFELAVGSDSNNTLYHARGFYIVNEIE
jgi:prepilin-type N-terminal cleavage/methylation domain-containing protein